MQAIEPYVVEWLDSSHAEMRENLLDTVKEAMQETQQLKDIVKNGGLPKECIAGYQEVKFCPFRQGDGNQCLHCFS